MALTLQALLASLVGAWRAFLACLIYVPFAYIGYKLLDKLMLGIDVKNELLEHNYGIAFMFAAVLFGMAYIVAQIL